ncbi:MAG: Hsp20/alpha crystallin family protein [Bacteroidetes bacterium]|nr:Hsp20/alpha crystallin family protein [Bacteroidota bacterium]
MLLQKRKAEFPVWGDVFGNLFNHAWTNVPQNFREPFGNIPAVNISESETEFKIEMAVPGKNKEDFKIDVKETILTISAEKIESTEKKEENYTRREYDFQSFRRSFRLPEIADSENTSATYTDGILTISVPKKEVKKHGVKTVAIS